MHNDIVTCHIDTTKPRNVFAMNGEWEVQPGDSDVPTTGWKHHVQVPGLVDLAQPLYDWRKHKYHWYRRRFRLEPAPTDGSTFLTLEQSMFGTEVWLNGNRVAGDIACYTSQEYDVTDFLLHGRNNELWVRVGAKETLPVESAVGKDQERMEFIPGVWGDVHVDLCGDPRIDLVQVIPHVGKKQAEVRVTVASRLGRDAQVHLGCRVNEKRSGSAGSRDHATSAVVPSKGTIEVTVFIPIDDMRLWTPDDPFLYQVQTVLTFEGGIQDCVRTNFGMREFRVSGADFLLNGKKILLKGGNIAFHRFLSDADRKDLPWNLDWVKKALIDIPREHNFNFIRSHLGQMYNRWYDLADEHGMLLQNEWMFWTTTGTKEQIRTEFRRWLKDNWNHPSIIIWDALNESSDPIVQREIVPEMKKLDPTRPWESTDFVEQHPYIYSLGPVLNEKKFGFTVEIGDLEQMPTPSVVNEFLWWWLDKDWNPTVLTKDVIQRWLGREYTTNDLINRQSFLALELVELFRRMRIDAIQPFVYLSNNAGPTAHWFVGDIKDLQPKPVLKALKNAFSPFGVSIELWDRHFFTGESRAIRIFVFNDDPMPRSGMLRYGVVRFDGEWEYDSSLKVLVDPSDSLASMVQILLPRRPGEYRIRAELSSDDSTEVLACSEKIAHVFGPLCQLSGTDQHRLSVLEDREEIAQFLAVNAIHVTDLSAEGIESSDVVIVKDGLVKGEEYRRVIVDLTTFVRRGGVLILIEPEYGVQEMEVIPVLDDLSLGIEPRLDADKGGYDSYVFAEDLTHPLWEGIEKKHLQMFNGAFGGEIVSQHHDICHADHKVLARCGMKLSVEAVFEIPYGEGKVIVSRLQLRGRLKRENAHDTLFARRPDPVLQRYFLNLVCYALKTEPVGAFKEKGKS